MGLRLLAWLLWPLGMALQTSVVVIAGWSDPDSARRVMVRPRVGALPIRTRGRAWYLACEQPLGGTVADCHVFGGPPRVLVPPSHPYCGLALAAARGSSHANPPTCAIDCARRQTAAPVVGSFGAVEPGCYAATQERNPLWNGCARDLE